MLGVDVRELMHEVYWAVMVQLTTVGDMHTK